MVDEDDVLIEVDENNIVHQKIGKWSVMLWISSRGRVKVAYIDKNG